MNNEIEQMTTLTAGILRSVLAASPEHNGTFRLVVTTNIGDTPTAAVGAKEEGQCSRDRISMRMKD